MELELSLDDGVVDLVKAGFDAGIRLGHAIEQDMAAVRLTPELGWSVVGAPDYLARAGAPALPKDLLRHATIRYRFNTAGTLPPWRFVVDGEELQLHTRAELVANDTGVIADLARQGLGLAYLPDIEIGADLAAGRLRRVLQAYVPPSPGLFLYFPVRTQHQPKLRALVDQALHMARQLEGIVSPTEIVS